MSKSPQPPSTTTKSNDPGKHREVPKGFYWKRFIARWSRWLHIYVSMLSFAIVFFFAVTGLTLNHAEKFGNEVHSTQSKGSLDVKWVKTPDTSSISKQQIIDFLKKQHHLKGALSDFRIDDAQIGVSFKGPGYAADIFIDRETGKYDLAETNAGFVGVLNDLHKGRDAGPIWSVVIDVSAILMTLISLTGMILLLYLKRKRLSGLLLAAMGIIIAWIIYSLCVK